MMIYTFIALIVFKRSIEYFQIFVFIGLSIWTFFNKNVNSSVQLLRKGRSMVTKIYFPKYILLLKNMMVNGYKMAISFALTFVLMLFFGAPYSLFILYSVPYFVMLIIVTFGFSCILMHLGVFIQDLSNIINVLLRLVFYLSGIFYDITSMVPAPWNSLLTKLNPVALAMHGCRNAILYKTSPDWQWLIIWIAIGSLLSALGIWLIYKYENSYGKVV